MFIGSEEAGGYQFLVSDVIKVVEQKRVPSSRYTCEPVERRSVVSDNSYLYYSELAAAAAGTWRDHRRHRNTAIDSKGNL